MIPGSTFQPFHPGSLACLKNEGSSAISGVTKDGHAIWIAQGPVLEVIDAQTRDRLASFEFGSAIGDQHTVVTCVREISVGKSKKLLVGLCNATPCGMVCLFDVGLSKVVKAVEIPHPVTELEVISTKQYEEVPRWALSEQLRYFCGLVAVGTSVGYVYLLDMCLDDDDFFTDEEMPSKVHFIWPRNRDVENQRFQCLSQCLHLCMTLNEEMFTKNGFEYQKPGGLVMKTFSVNQVSVTCLKYIPQAGLLAIGYNFGCYQLWKLHIPVLEYSSRLESEPLPVCHLAYQEPENDPKNFCYLWVARGPLSSDDEYDIEPISTLSMYQLAFKSKAFYSEYGVFYDELSSVCLRLDYELTSTPIRVGSRYDGSSRVIACYTLEDPMYQSPKRLKEEGNNEESFEETYPGPDLSLCVFVWEATEGQESDRRGTHLAVFDINRWYHAQMPSSVRYASSSLDTCSYMCFYRLDPAIDNADADSLLMAHLNWERVSKFISDVIIPPEQHFYPASLAFDVKLVFERGLMDVRFLGSQRQVLADLERKGVQALVLPTDTYSMCVYTGLLPRSPEAAISTHQQREALLTLALDYNMVNFIKTCVSTLGAGEFESQGFGLKSLLDWTWEKVSTTKHTIDTTCTNLYNWSGLTLDNRAVLTLYQCYQKLRHLEAVFKEFQQLSGPITSQGQTELSNKILVTSLIRQHLDIVLWFHDVGLLPETDDSESSLGNPYCYPASSLVEAYKVRREELQHIHSGIGECDLLLVDGLIDQLGGKDLWCREGGSGLYPPPSLYALLSSYLLEKTDITLKHALVLYVLLDLVSLDSHWEEDQTFSERVSTFATCFCVPQALSKIIQAFWLLDHREFQDAMSLLLGPVVLSSQYRGWQHVRVLKSLLYQGESKLALRYLDIVQPALSTSEEVQLKLTILLANGLTSFALEYQRQCQDSSTMNDLLTHIFMGCKETKTLDKLLRLALSKEEEEAVIRHMLESPDIRDQERLVMYYLQRSRIVEAIQLNDKLKQSVLSMTDPKARERVAARNAIVDSHAANLPRVQCNLLKEHIHLLKRNTQKRLVTRPKPLSTKVTKNHSRVMSRSALILSIMEKLDEVEGEEDDRTEAQNKSIPFIRTPVTPARSSQRNTPAIVYPEEAGADCNRSGFTLHRSFNPFQSNGTPQQTHRYVQAYGTPQRTNRQSRYFSASCLQLLQTPTVKKVTPKKQRLSNVVTPQSILKVRHMITTSPSPHSSANNTPGSIESSARKNPRKLGYGSSQPSTPQSAGVGDKPMSSLPRHLMAEKQASRPTTPKSVSFVEPGSPSDSSEPTTPLNAQRAMPSATKLQLLSTPQLLKGARSKTNSPAQGSTVKTALKSAGRGRSLKDRSPTPESPEKSPKFASKTDQLSRPPLRTTPVKQETQGEDLILRLSDSENEDAMDTSMHSSPAVSNTSFASTSTAKNREDLHISLSPEAASPEQPLSPQQQSHHSASSSPSSSPTVQVSRTELLTPSTKAPDNVTVTSTVETGSELGRDPVTSRVDIDDGDLMETEEGVSSSQSAQSVAASCVPEDVEEMEAESAMAPSVDVFSTDRQIKQEVVDEVLPMPPKPERHLVPPVTYTPDMSMLRRKSLTPPSERNIPFVAVKTRDSPPSAEKAVSSAKHLNVSASSSKHDDSLVKMIDDVFGESPTLKQETLTLTEVDVDRLNKPRNIKPYSLVLPEVKDTDSAKSPSSPGLSQQRRSVNKEDGEPLTPRRSSRCPTRTSTVADMAVSTDDRLVELSAESPKKCSEEAKQAVQEALLQISEEIKMKDEEGSAKMLTRIKDKSRSPARTPTRQRHTVEEVTPPRSDFKFSVELLIEEQVADSPAKSTRSRRSSLEPQKATTPRRGRHKKDENTSPLRDSNTNNISDVTLSPSALNADIAASVRKKTPLRSRRKKEEKNNDELEAIPETAPFTPTRKSRRQKAEPEDDTVEDIGHSEIPDDIDENGSDIGTPSRRVSLSRSCKVAQHINSPSRRKSLQAGDLDVSRTPTRSSRTIKKDTAEEEEEVKENVPKTDELKGKATTPRRGRKKKVENEEEMETTVIEIETTVMEIEDEKPVPETPTRRGRPKKITVEETKPETPRRRGPRKKTDNDKTEGETSEAESLPQTPSRRTPSRRANMITDVKLETDETSETETKTKTPSRRGHSKKTESDVTEGETSEAESLPKTPSRRTPSRRAKKQVTDDGPESETKSVTPLRRGRGRKTTEMLEKSENKNKTADDSEMSATPSRRGRGRKSAEKSEKSEDNDDTTDGSEIPATPSRRGRGRKAAETSEKSDDTNEKEDESETPATPSRRGRGRKAAEKSEKSENSDETADDLEQPATPARRTRQKGTTPTRSTRSSRKAKKDATDSMDSDSKAEDSEIMSEGEEQKVLTPSRRRQARIVENSEDNGATEAESANLTPSRSKKARRSKDSSPAPKQPDVYDIKSTKFQFSDPSQPQVATDEMEEPKAFTPTPSFIFSPPLPRTRPAIPSETVLLQQNILLPPGPAVELPLGQKIKKTSNKTKMRKLYQEDTILQLTPTSPNISDSGEEGREIMTRTTRSTKRVSKKDGTMQVLQRIAKAPRTKFRFGPVGGSKK